MVHYSSEKPLKAVLFDLDGTLLDVEMAEFIPAYVQGLASHFTDLAEPDRFADTVLAATFALIRDDSVRASNEALFLEAMHRRLGIEAVEFVRRLDAFVEDGLGELAPMVRASPAARDILQLCFDRGLRVVIATNPVFPRPVIDARLQWGDLHDFDYSLVTSYENTRLCKPHPGYFHDILAQFNLDPEQCLMVGNDTEHDLAAGQVGIPTFLVETWMIDRLDGVFQSDMRGDHDGLLEFLQKV
jgi:FMN phosphatase YigB (HAD superfamily)